jgi:hypothetical protein
MNWPDELICAHELGHAIVGQEEGLAGEIRLEVSWWSNAITGGFCELKSLRYPEEDTGNPDDWKAYRGMLLMTAGGQAASEHWFQLRDQRIEDTAGSDRIIFNTDAPVMPNAPSWEQAVEEAKHLILPRWDDVVRLTPELLERRRMAGSKV